MSLTLVLAWALALALLPVLIITRVSESQTDRIQRWYASGMSQRAIAKRLGIGRHKVAQALA
jgi:hypothetical protein